MRSRPGLCSEPHFWSLRHSPTQASYLLSIRTGGPKTDTQFYFWDNFGNSAPILTIILLLQVEIYGA